MEAIKNVLRSRDSKSGDVVSNDYTYASVIYELSDKPKFIIAPGKPHETDYIAINLEWNIPREPPPKIPAAAYRWKHITSTKLHWSNTNDEETNNTNNQSHTASRNDHFFVLRTLAFG